MMHVHSPLEWHNLHRLQDVLAVSAGSEYLTLGSLMDDRRESQLERVDVAYLDDPYRWVIDEIRQRLPDTGLPPSGRLRFRVRLWGPDTNQAGMDAVAADAHDVQRPRPREPTRSLILWSHG